MENIFTDSLIPSRSLIWAIICWSPFLFLLTSPCKTWMPWSMSPSTNGRVTATCRLWEDGLALILKWVMLPGKWYVPLHHIMLEKICFTWRMRSLLVQHMNPTHLVTIITWLWTRGCKYQFLAAMTVKVLLLLICLYLNRSYKTSPIYWNKTYYSKYFIHYLLRYGTPKIYM